MYSIQRGSSCEEVVFGGGGAAPSAQCVCVAIAIDAKCVGPNKTIRDFSETIIRVEISFQVRARVYFFVGSGGAVDRPPLVVTLDKCAT